MRAIRFNAMAGFAHVGLLALLVVVAAGIGGGAYVVYQHNQVKPSASQTAASSGTQSNGGNNATSTVTASAGTTASVVQLTQADAQAEANVDKSGDTQLQQDAGSANAAQSNVGGAYNEANF